MAYGFERTGYVSAQGSANDLPDGDWAVGGWVRIEDNHGNEAPQIVDQHPPAAARFSLAYYEDEYPLPDCRNRSPSLCATTLGWSEGSIPKARTLPAGRGNTCWSSAAGASFGCTSLGRPTPSRRRRAAQ